MVRISTEFIIPGDPRPIGEPGRMVAADVIRVIVFSDAGRLATVAVVSGRRIRKDGSWGGYANAHSLTLEEVQRCPWVLPYLRAAEAAYRSATEAYAATLAP